MLWLNTKRASFLALFLILLIFEWPQFTHKLSAYFYPSGKKSDYYYQIDCRIYDQYMELLFDVPASYCSFLSNGSVVIGTSTNLSLYDSHLRLIWSQEMSIHHLFNITANEEKILLMKNSFHEFLGEKTRFDELEVIEIKTGKTLASWNSFNAIDELMKSVPWTYEKKMHKHFWRKNELEKYKAKFEFFHFNSIYEIPRNAYSDEIPFLKEGGIISNSGMGPILFFDKNLKLLHILNVDNQQRVNTHDAQILKSGELLFYRNKSKSEDFSSLQKYDLKNKQYIYKFTGNTDLKSFYSWRLGSVQDLGDRYLFSNLTDHGNIREISKNGKTLRSIENPLLDPQTHKPREMMRLRKLDLSSFIFSYKGF